MAMVVILIGPSGTGKSTVGRLLAETLHWPFHDGDDFHSPANIERMRSGLPLSDTERDPWLAALAQIVADGGSSRHSLVLACSALTRRYRRRLVPAHSTADSEAASSATVRDGVHFVYLRTHPAVLAERLDARSSHFFPPALLASQLAVFEPPADDEPAPVITVDGGDAPQEIVAEIRRQLRV